jgi:membrane protein implicated in regulation of membrane protease activity
MFGGNWNPIDIFKNNEIHVLLEGHYWNYESKKSFKEGQTTVGLIRINGDLWLLFHVGKITRDLTQILQ